jgi:dsRNA-specific ribonuclease
LSSLEKLQQRLQKHQWESTFSVDCSGPQDAQLWKVSFFLRSTMIGESGWFTNRDSAKENAAMKALAWLNKHYLRSPSPGAQPLSYRQLLQERLQKYQRPSTCSVDCSGPQDAQLWKVSFFLRSTMIGESGWFTNKDAAKENAAIQGVGWLNTHGYP